MEQSSELRLLYNNIRRKAARTTSRNRSMLCEDIIFLVLSLLPPEASARFKSVCSHWNHLISTSSHLLSLHKCCADSKRVIGFYHGSKVHENLQFAVLRYEDSEQDVHSISSEFDERIKKTYGYSVCATCDGFFLLDYVTKLFLRNPLMKTSVKIPLPPRPNPDEEDLTRLIYFGLDVSSSSSSKQGGNIKLVFKIMKISIDLELESSSCSIYSSLTGDWMPLELDDMVLKQFSSPQSPVLARWTLDPYPSLNPVGATFLRRSLHWLFDDGRIFAFDLDEQIWRHMETPAARGGLRLIKNYSDIIFATVNSVASELMFEFDVELANKLSCYLYSNIWLGCVGEHIYLLLVIDETNLQLWMLDNYDEVEWRIIVDIKNCGFVAPLFFDGRRIFIAAFDFEEWKNKKVVIRFFDIFTRKWLPTNLTITDDLDQIRFFFAMIRPRCRLDIVPG